MLIEERLNAVAKRAGLVSRCATLSLVLAAAMMAATTSAVRADDENPDWPCVWRKTVTLDAAAIWDGPSLDTAKKWRNDNDVRNLSQYLIVRRVPLEEIEKEIADFAKGLKPEEHDQKLVELFAGVLDRSNTDRKQVVKGIERFHKRQLERAKLIEKEGGKLPDIDQPLTNEPVLATEIDKLTPEQERFNWDVRVFTERQQNMPLACEIPQLMDERAGAIARAIRALMKD